MLVTGASSGIGGALARALALRTGVAKVILLARTEAKLAAAVAELNAARPGCAAFVAVDCSDGAAVEAAAAAVRGAHGVPDVIVNCAGAGKWRYLHEMSLEDVRGSVAAPYLCAAFVTRCFLRVRRGLEYASLHASCASASV